MALIKCPECGKEQSSFAKICAYCSFPLEEYSMEPERFVLAKESEDTIVEETVDVIVDDDNSKIQVSEAIQENSTEFKMIENSLDESITKKFVDAKRATYNGPVYDFSDYEFGNNNGDSIVHEMESKLFINMGLIHKIIDWPLAVFIIIFSIIPLFGGSPIVGLIWMMAGVLLLPIGGILSFWDKISQGKRNWRRPFIIVAVIITGLFFI